METFAIMLAYNSILFFLEDLNIKIIEEKFEFNFMLGYIKNVKTHLR
jgi:hypothetical protein